MPHTGGSVELGSLVSGGPYDKVLVPRPTAGVVVGARETVAFATY